MQICYEEKFNSDARIEQGRKQHKYSRNNIKIEIKVKFRSCQTVSKTQMYKFKFAYAHAV